jgi:hypothetical protein
MSVIPAESRAETKDVQQARSKARFWDPEAPSPPVHARQVEAIRSSANVGGAFVTACRSEGSEG